MRRRGQEMIRRRALRVEQDRTQQVEPNEVPVGHHRWLPDEEGGSHLGTSEEEALKNRRDLSSRRSRGG